MNAYQPKRRKPPLRIAPSQIVWALVLLATLVSAFMLSWTINRHFDYGYRFWYGQMAIGEHIARYAPQNRYIRGFDSQSEDQVVALFAEITDAVHHQGQGLGDITFTDSRGRVRTLLREPEIVHLQDVANLIDTLTMAGGFAILMAGIGALLLVQRKVPIQLRPQLALFAGLITGLTLLTLVIGPEAVFYQFHVWVFPDEHQWFFYYQDSLMSTLMKAPDLFGGIAISITALGVLLFTGFVLLLRWLTR